MRNSATALICGAIVLIVGALGPWVTVLGFMGMGPTTDASLALVIFGCIGLVFISAFTGRRMRAVSVFVGVVMLGEVVRVLIRIHDSAENSDLINSGWGLYLTAVAGIFLILSTWIVDRDF